MRYSIVSIVLTPIANTFVLLLNDPVTPYTGNSLRNTTLFV